MMEFSIGNENAKARDTEAFMANLIGAIRSEQVPHLTAIIESSLDLARSNEWDAKTTSEFVKDLIDIYVGAQIDFVQKLAG